MVVRHLLLPGRLDDSKQVLSFLWNRYGNQVLYSIMNQYTPVALFPAMPELEQRVPQSDYEALLDYCDSMGLTFYYWQEGSAAQESFIPPFDHTGV